MTRWTACLLAGLLLWPAVARAVSGQPEVIGIRVGFAGRYKVGLWTPVEVILRGGDEPLDGQVCVTVPDGEGVPSRVSTPPDRPCRLLPGEETKVTLCVRFGRVESELRAEFQVDGQVVARRTFPPSGQGAQRRPKASGDSEAEPQSGYAIEMEICKGIESEPLVVCVGPVAAAVEEAAALQGRDSPRRPVVARLDDVACLPTQWFGYEGVDALVLSTSRPRIYKDIKSDSPHLAALEQWVRMGGKLLLCGGDAAEQVVKEGMPLARFVPGKLERVVTLRQTTAVERYAGGQVTIPQPPGGQPIELRVLRLAEVQGVIEEREADLPIVVRQPRGFGQVVFFAADLDRGPLATWTGTPNLAARLLDLPTSREETPEGKAATRLGYDDLAGQLRSALDRFPGVRLAPFWVVAFLVLGYLLLIGPGDYFFLRRLRRRMEWTWATFPVIVLLASLGAYLLAHWLKGDQVRINQAEIVDVDADSGLVRGTHWAGVFSPRTETFDLSLDPRLPGGESAEQGQSLLGWLGLPGRGFGGMNPQAPNPIVWSGGYDFSSNLEAIHGVPIPIAASRSFTTRWTATSTAAAAAIEADLTGTSGLLDGAIRNRLDDPLEECVLAYGRWVYYVGTLKKEDPPFRLTPISRRAELKTVVTAHATVSGDAKTDNVGKPAAYDPAGVEVSSILRAMMLYQEAGGRHSTKLVNDYQSFVDLSGSLRAGRAILIARPTGGGDAPRPTILLRDGRRLGSPDDPHVTMYRFVLPVKNTQSNTEN
jgi:hypothetical protein